MITVVDYGVGNIASLINMLDHLGFRAMASGDPAEIEGAEKLILPGVGAFDKAMRTLAERKLIEPIRTAALQLKTPLLGVCLGMQLLANRSEEGVLPGLGLVDAEVLKIPHQDALKVPHIGWAEVAIVNPSPLFPAVTHRERFYFVHSYYIRPTHREDEAAAIEYGDRLCVAVSKGNIHGVQFHPEKSHRYGMRLLKSFAELS